MELWYALFLIGMCIAISVSCFIVLTLITEKIIYGAVPDFNYDECMKLLNSTDLCGLLEPEIPPLDIQEVSYNGSVPFP